MQANTLCKSSFFEKRMGMYGLASRLEDHLAVERNLLNNQPLYSKLSWGCSAVGVG